MTSATDELRRLLDKLGVAHSDHYLSTTWRDGHGIIHLAGEPMADGLLVVDMLTPEQAIAATLGSEREERLEKLVLDMWFWGYEGHMDSKSQDWQMKHIDGVLDRMKELGIGVICKHFEPKEEE